MIVLSDVTVARGPNMIVTGLTLSIEPGRIFWIVGRNGAGKSSLLRVLVGMDPPRRGTIAQRGQIRRVLYFQSEMMLPGSATVRSWEKLSARLAGAADSTDAPGAVRPAADHTPLWPTPEGRRRVSRLSTGERKRLLLDALLREPGPIVADEPFEHLSPDARAVLRDMLERRAREHVVVVATNQATELVARDGGIRLETGTATLLTGTAAQS